MTGDSSITPEQVLQFTSPTEDFICPVTANTYNIEFYRFTITDVESRKVLFDVERSADDYEPPENIARLPLEVQRSLRTINYRFPASMLYRKTISARLVFGINGDRPVPNFRMIERHYFRNTLIKSFDFNFGFCIPHSTNTWESIYDMPELSEEWKQAIVQGVNETVSDSFYFVDGKLVMHNKASYAYDAHEISSEI